MTSSRAVVASVGSRRACSAGCACLEQRSERSSIGVTGDAVVGAGGGSSACDPIDVAPVWAVRLSQAVASGKRVATTNASLNAGGVRGAAGGAATAGRMCCRRRCGESVTGLTHHPRREEVVQSRPPVTKREREEPARHTLMTSGDGRPHPFRRVRATGSRTMVAGDAAETGESVVSMVETPHVQADDGTFSRRPVRCGRVVRAHERVPATPSPP